MRINWKKKEIHKSPDSQLNQLHLDALPCQQNYQIIKFNLDHTNEKYDI